MNHFILIFPKFIQETVKPETKDNISNVTENLDTNYGCEIRADEETDFKKLADLNMLKSEIAGKLGFKFQNLC